MKDPDDLHIIDVGAFANHLGTNNNVQQQEGRVAIVHSSLVMLLLKQNPSSILMMNPFDVWAFASDLRTKITAAVTLLLPALTGSIIAVGAFANDRETKKHPTAVDPHSLPCTQSCS